MFLNRFTFSYTRTIILLLVFISVPLKEIFPHRDDFIDETIVYLTLAKQELELEYWFDYGSQSSSYFINNNFASEFGITNHWMIDGRITYHSPEVKNFNFQSGRFETRYRFYDEGVKPIDVAVSAEINSEKTFTGETESGIEGRLILSKDFEEKLNLTLNLAEEKFFERGKASFNPSFGFRYDANSVFRFGSEFKYETADKWGAVVPQVWFTFGKALTLKLGYSIGFKDNPVNFGRLAFEAEL